MAIAKKFKDVSKKEAVKEELSVQEVAVQEVVPQSPVQPAPVRKVRDVYMLLINDEVSVIGTARVPTGVWYAVFIQFGLQVKMYGPYVLTFVDSKGQERELTGFVQEDTLRDTAGMMYARQQKEGFVEPAVPLKTSSGMNKMLSFWRES